MNAHSDTQGAEHQPDDFDPNGCRWLAVVCSLSAIVAVAVGVGLWRAL